MANGKKKKSRKKLYIFGGLGLLVLILVIVALAGGSKENIILVQTEKVAKRSITQTVTATGTIDPEFKVLITPEVTGEIINHYENQNLDSLADHPHKCTEYYRSVDEGWTLGWCVKDFIQK